VISIEKFEYLLINSNSLNSIIQGSIKFLYYHYHWSLLFKNI